MIKQKQQMELLPLLLILIKQKQSLHSNYVCFTDYFFPPKNYHPIMQFYQKCVSVVVSHLLVYCITFALQQTVFAQYLDVLCQGSSCYFSKYTNKYDNHEKCMFFLANKFVYVLYQQLCYILLYIRIEISVPNLKENRLFETKT